jgi:hypothetical protein
MRSNFTDRHKVRKNTKPGEARLSSAQHRVSGVTPGEARLSSAQYRVLGRVTT